MDSTTREDRLLDLVERQAKRLGELEAKLQTLAPDPEPAPEVANKPWQEMTADEKATYTGWKYSTK